MNLGPCDDQTLLPDRETSTYSLDRIGCEDRDTTLIVSMEVGPVVRAAGFDEHPDDDSKESADLRHDCIFGAPLGHLKSL